MDTTRLYQLAALAGIHHGYHDIWGTWQALTPHTASALLEAMGFSAGSDVEIEESLRALDARAWSRPLPPVFVVRRGEPVRVPLVIDAADRAGSWTWIVDEEDGTHRSSSFEPGDLSVEDEWRGGAVHRVRVLLPIHAPLDLGYHTLTIVKGAKGDAATRSFATTSLVVTPSTCWIPPGIREGNRQFGIALQLYALRSGRNWGIGDFTDLKDLAAPAASQGVTVLGLNPLHALFLTDPDEASPYSPSSRLWVNILYIDVEAVPDFNECSACRDEVRSPAFQETLRRLRESEFVDYAAVARIKLRSLENLFTFFRDRHWGKGTDRDRAFRAFLEVAGTSLRRQATYDALQQHFREQDPTCWGWPAWPDAYRTPGAPAVIRWEKENEDRVLFYCYLQWQADEQLRRAAEACAEKGMEIGLYRDLAVSVNRAGAEAWSNQDLYARGVSVGAPPDPFALNGQDWGLPPYIPDTLRENAYAPFIETLRQNMRHAGALRIDHVMGLLRLYWIAPGRAAIDGAYVGYPFQDLLGILALESRRHRCLVVGEDLGTVPDEVRDALRAYGVLSYKILYFERRKDEEFRDPSEIEAQALASVTTQDLPTWMGWWTGHDLGIKTRLGQFPSTDVSRRVADERGLDRRRLLRALGRQGLLPAGVTVEHDPFFVPPSAELGVNVHRYLARSPAWIMLAVPEDLLAMKDQTNLPGTVHEHPNWRRKLTVEVGDLLNATEARLILAGMRRERSMDD